MSVFISHSGRDSDAAQLLLGDIEDGGHDAWLDHVDLKHGDVWWSKILEQIRACDVFVFAVSDNSLRSDPCNRELDYAEALGLPILPVQIGRVTDMRGHPIFLRQVLDYCEPTKSTGLGLIRALGEQAARRGDLPKPLPSPPPIPFEYLLRLGDAIRRKETLSPGEQAGIVAQLRHALREEQDQSVQSSVDDLLRQFLRRSDLAMPTFDEIEAVLGPRGAGWHADPAGTDRMRYWDGANWSERFRTVHRPPRNEPPRDVPPPPIAPAVDSPPTNYLVWAVLSTLLCCPPVGIVAIVYSTKVSSLWQQGQRDQARSAATSARNWTVVSAVAWVIIMICYLVYVAAKGTG